MKEKEGRSKDWRNIERVVDNPLPEWTSAPATDRFESYVQHDLSFSRKIGRGEPGVFEMQRSYDCLKKWEHGVPGVLHGQT